MSEQKIRQCITDYQAAHGKLPTTREVAEQVGGKTASIGMVLREFKDDTPEGIQRRIDRLDADRAALDRSQREIGELLELSEANESATRAVELLAEARELAEEAIKETRAERRQRLESGVAKAESTIEQLRPALVDAKAVVDRLQGEYAEAEKRFGRRTVMPGLQEEILDARRSWHGVQREIKQAEERIQACRAELGTM